MFCDKYVLINIKFDLPLPYHYVKAIVLCTQYSIVQLIHSYMYNIVTLIVYFFIINVDTHEY